MEKILAWQSAVLGGIVAWILMSSTLDITRKIRSFLQPWVTHHVVSGIPFILQIQNSQHKLLDALFSTLSCVVSVPFYTAFLPLLFWSGHGKLARQMTLLMAFCDYTGNSIKDVVSAPRPSCPPIRRLTATKDEKRMPKNMACLHLILLTQLAYLGISCIIFYQIIQVAVSRRH